LIFFAHNPTKDDGIFFYTTFDSLRNHKVMTAQKKINGNHILRFGHLLNEDEELIRSYKTRFGSVVLFMFPLIAIVMWLLTKRTVRGIHQVTLAADQITQGNLKARVMVERESAEITLLANTFNSMSERIELLVKEMRDVTHNIAHDLRSPVTRIRGTAEITLSGSQQLSDYQEMTGVIIEECDNLTNMINTLLDIAEADSSISGAERIKIDLKKLVEEGHELFLPLAKLKQIKLTFQTASEEVLILGRLQHIQRMISNLIDNAIKYTEKGGSILIQLAEEEGQAILSVVDSGVGIPKDELEHIFKPFYRCDQSRSTPGNGLGLSYVRSVVESHGGTVSVVSVLNQGSTFRTTFPQLSMGH
jgi:signal transduction histidine kinase